MALTNELNESETSWRISWWSFTWKGGDYRQRWHRKIVVNKHLQHKQHNKINDINKDKNNTCKSNNTNTNTNKEKNRNITTQITTTQKNI